MNLGFNFRGGLENLPGILEAMVARINTVWKKQHNIDGSHGNITAGNITTSGSLKVLDGQYPGPGIWTGFIPMPQPVLLVQKITPATPGVNYEIGLLSRENIHIHTDSTIRIQGQIIALQGEDPTSPGSPGDSIGIEASAGIIIAALGFRPVAISSQSGDVGLSAGDEVTIDATNIVANATNDATIHADDDLLLEADGDARLIGTDLTHIQFPATASPSAGATILDDYREGTHTPTNLNVALSGSLTYVKVGAQVTLSGDVTWAINSDANQAEFSLPFELGPAANPAGCIPFLCSVANTAIWTFDPTDARAYLIDANSGAPVSNITMSGQQIRFTLSYETDA